MRKAELDLKDEYINNIYNQRIDGNTFLNFTTADFERWGIPDRSVKKSLN